MRLEAKKYLYDIQSDANLLKEFTHGKTLADYQREAMLRAAVERQFEVIGEAMNRLVSADEIVADRIIAFRNILIHQYTDVDDRLVWDVLETKLPTLSREVDALLDEEGA